MTWLALKAEALIERALDRLELALSDRDKETGLVLPFRWKWRWFWRGFFFQPTSRAQVRREQNAIIEWNMEHGFVNPHALDGIDLS